MTVDDRSDKAVTPGDPLSMDEVDRRREAVEFARRSVRYEGFTLSVETEATSRRFIAGEIDAREFAAAVAALR